MKDKNVINKIHLNLEMQTIIMPQQPTHGLRPTVLKLIIDIR